MRLSWGEIRSRAKAFSEDWKDAHYERGETQSFYNDFFDIFGVKRRQVAVYEKRVEMIERNKRGFIDLFWPGTLIIEQKSAGRDLIAAQNQAFDYFDGLKEIEQPRYILTCDFQRFRLLDLDSRDEVNFTLPELQKNIDQFSFILGRRRTFGAQAAVNIKAAELLGRLHDALETSGYVGHDLERLLVRLLFCLFADDTGIFEPKDIFLNLIEERTAEDGSDVGRWLNDLFDTLDTDESFRQFTLDPELKTFPYVNGELFSGRLKTPHFDNQMREMLLDAARFDWGKVSPAIFGSLFQSVMNADQRRKKGAHYTSETNIQKVIGPLFLDQLRDEFSRIDARKIGRESGLQEFQRKLRRLRFLDPACGCGNFLVVAYRELRALELEVLKRIHPREARQPTFDPALFAQVNVDQFYGIEYEEFPARIAEVAMWMTDHLANNEFNEAFGANQARIPLRQSAHILHGDALEVDWNDLLPPSACTYVLGNPPFVGAKYQSEVQRSQVRRIANLGGSGGTLDYVAAWFIKAGRYMSSNKRICIGFVSTNSITQGEQAAQLWPVLFERYQLEIIFAHRTFMWNSEARGKADVHVVVIGLASRENNFVEQKRLFTYPRLRGEPVETTHSALTAYLFDARSVANRHLVVKEESSPLHKSPRLISGSKPIDGGYLILTEREKRDLDANDAVARKYIRPYIGTEEYIHGGRRWILALQGASPEEIKESQFIIERIRAVRMFRLGLLPPKISKTRTVKAQGSSSTALAYSPTSFHVTVIPDAPFLVIPELCSERREYVPIGWLEPPVVPSNLVRVLANATLWHFGVLTSRMHMAWLQHIGGRLKSDYRYSVGLVYNTFPWPISETHKKEVSALAQAVLDSREPYTTSNLADLYDPDTMPTMLRSAHARLDAAVDKLYRAAPFVSDRDRVEHLFGLYEAQISPLEREGVKQNRRVNRSAKKIAKSNPD